MEHERRHNQRAICTKATRTPTEVSGYVSIERIYIQVHDIGIESFWSSRKYSRRCLDSGTISAKSAEHVLSAQVLTWWRSWLGIRPFKLSRSSPQTLWTLKALGIVQPRLCSEISHLKEGSMCTNVRTTIIITTQGLRHIGKSWWNFAEVDERSCIPVEVDQTIPLSLINYSKKRLPWTTWHHLSILAGIYKILSRGPSVMWKLFFKVFMKSNHVVL